MKKIILSIVSCMIVSFQASANTSPLIAIGADFGGDKIVDVTYSDGSKSSIEAGRGLLLSFGALIGLSESFETQASVGIKWTSTKKATNGQVDFSRFPAELLLFYRVGDFRIGGGATYHFNNKVKGTKEAAVISGDFENAVGYIGQADYFFGAAKNIGFGAKYTAIEYEPKNSDTKVDANSFGLTFTYLFM